MPVSKHDRDEYEQGLNDSKLPFLERNIKDVVVDHPDSEAYYKGRDEEQLDEDKNEDDDK
jgi:hypothetical protein